MTATGLHHLNVRCTKDKLEATRAFYERYLGLKVGPRPPFRDHGYWMYHQDHPWVHISIADKASKGVSNRDAGFGHIAFYGTDYRGLMKMLESDAIKYDERPSPDDRLMQVFFPDPNGVMVEMVYPIADAQAAAKKTGKKVPARA